MTKLFEIIGFCFSPTGTTISIDTSYCDEPFMITKKRFEKWVDDREYRKDKATGLLMAWDYYYPIVAEKDLYEYIILMQGDAAFNIEVPLKRIEMN